MSMVPTTERTPPVCAARARVLDQPVEQLADAANVTGAGAPLQPREVRLESSVTEIARLPISKLRYHSIHMTIGIAIHGRLRAASAVQSARSPCSGSIAAARRAGSRHAASAVTAASATATANATPSPDDTPYSRLDSARPSANAPAAPAARADQRQPQPLPDDQPQHVARLRAERHPHAQLLPPLVHAERQHAVDAERRQHERQRREHAHQQHQRARPIGRLADDADRACAPARAAGSGSSRCTAVRTAPTSAAGSPCPCTTMFKPRNGNWR